MRVEKGKENNMESEKVKEIKKDLEICMISLTCENCNHYSQRSGECCRDLTNDILTLINELESENKRLKQSVKDYYYTMNVIDELLKDY